MTSHIKYAVDSYHYNVFWLIPKAKLEARMALALKAAKLKLDQLVSLIINQYELAFSGIVPFFESLNAFCDKFDAFGNKTLDKFWQLLMIIERGMFWEYKIRKERVLAIQSVFEY